MLNDRLLTSIMLPRASIEWLDAPDTVGTVDCQSGSHRAFVVCGVP